MLYLTERKTLEPSLDAPSLSEGGKVQEDEVDKLLAGRDGRVHRNKDPQM